MAFVVNTHSLSAITPIKFVYKYNTEEKLAGSYASLKGDFAYFKHNALVDFKDAAFSRKTCLILTDKKRLENIFENANEELALGEIAGTLYIKVGTKVVTETDNNLYVGGTGSPVLITIVPLDNGLAELRVNRTKYIEIDKTYPYTARLTEEIVDGSDLQFRHFEIEYSNGLISFKVKTPEGYRFLSYGVDNVLRAVGLELNETIVNSYRYNADYRTRETMNYNYTPDEKEIKYFNNATDQKYKTDLTIKDAIDRETNLLITYPTSKLTKEKGNTINVNIASLKTNYTSNGTYTPSI